MRDSGPYALSFPFLSTPLPNEAERGHAFRAACGRTDSRPAAIRHGLRRASASAKAGDAHVLASAARTMHFPVLGRSVCDKRAARSNAFRRIRMRRGVRRLAAVEEV
jgi:hypothetical protein